MKKLAIILPLYNAASKVERALKSVIDQLSEEDEIIVIDGGSTDGTVDIVRKYEKHITYFVSEKDKGYADALNKGINAATAEYFMMLAGDDLLLPGAILEMKQSLEADTDVWAGSILVKDKNLYRVLASDRDLEKLRLGCSLKHPAAVFRRSAVVEAGLYDTAFKCAADRELFLRMYLNKYSFQIEDIRMVLFTVGGMSTDGSSLAVKENYEVSIKYGTSKEAARIVLQREEKKTLKRKFREGLTKLAGCVGLLGVWYKIIGTKCISRREYRRLYGKEING